MALVLRELYKQYLYYTNEARDTRLENYFLIGSPLKVIAILAMYLYFVNRLGPQIMEKRKPCELNSIMRVYNLFQVVANLIIAFSGTYYVIANKLDLKCIPIEYSNTSNGLIEANLTYFYFLLKLIDLLDTIFFILRKKYNQVTFLHVYHHAIMVWATWIVANYVPGGHGGILGIINCYVHAVMYSYYFLTSGKSDLKSSLWWKKYITNMQMLQFAILIVHFGHPLLFGNCEYPKTVLCVGVIQNIFMLGMFGDFYYKAYIQKSKKQHKNK